MANQLTDFIQLIKKNSIARTNRFRIYFDLPTGVIKAKNYISKGDYASQMSLTCLIADMPGETIQNTGVSYGNFERKIPFGRTYSDFTSTFLLTGKYVEKKIFDVWMSLIIDENQHALGYYDDYVTNIFVECLNEQNDVMYKFEIKEAYPVSVSPLKFDRTAQNGQMILDVTWAFFTCDAVLDNVTTALAFNSKVVRPNAVGVNAGKQRLLPIPGIDQLSSAVQSAAAVGTEFRGQLQGVLNITNDVKNQVRDLKMSSVDGIKTLNGVVKDVKAINNIPTDVKREVVDVVTSTKNQIGYLNNDIHTINKYPTK